MICHIKIVNCSGVIVGACEIVMRGFGQDGKLRRVNKSRDWLDLRNLHHRSSRFLRYLSKGLENRGKKIALELSSFLIRGLAASTGYTLGLLAAQAVGYGLRISCATPILSSCLGGIGVISASTLAGHFSKCTKLIHRDGWHALHSPEIQTFHFEDVVVDIIIGVSFYKILGGKFRNTMPSDLFHPGAHAVQSIQAKSANYATEEQRQILTSFFRRHGCHTCGTRFGKVIGDHMPPNKFVKLADPMAVIDRLGFGKQARLVMKLFDLELPVTSQRFYPQCSTCSLKQSTAVKLGRQVLIYHVGGPRTYHASALLIGLHNHET